MAATRKSQRSTAGNRLRQLLDEEAAGDVRSSDPDEDDVYEGIFKEEEQDEEFEANAEEEEDIVDSDFDISETDEPIDGDEEAEARKPRPRPRAAEAGTEAPGGADARPAPKRKPRPPTQPPVQHGAASTNNQLDALDSLISAAAAGTADALALALAPSATAAAAAAPHASHKARKPRPTKPALLDPSLRRSSARRSTVTNTTLAEQRRAAKAERKAVRVPRAPEVVLTQAQRLEEAKETERLNVASLEAFKLREEERKKTSKRTVVYAPPASARAHPVADPAKGLTRGGLLDAARSPLAGPSLTGPRVAVLSKRVVAATDPVRSAAGGLGAKSAPPYGRQLVSFYGYADGDLERLLHPPQRTAPVAPLCVITGRPARYLDPLTRQPYASLEAFRLVRARECVVLPARYPAAAVTS